VRSRSGSAASASQTVSATGLPGTVEGDRGHPAVEEGLLGRAELLLGGVEAGDHQDHGVRALAVRRADDRDQPRPLEGDLEPSARRVEVRQRLGEAGDRPPVGRAHLLGVGDEDELREVVVDRRAGQVLTGGAQPALGERVAAELLVGGALGGPGAAPVLPAFDAGGDPREVGGGDAVGGEPRAPVGHGGGDQVVHRHLRGRSRSVDGGDPCHHLLQTSAA
jgi:hypothetical protein